MADEPSKSAAPTAVQDPDTISPAAPTSNNAPPATVLADKAAKFIAEHGEIEFDYEDERSVLKLVDRRILPLLLGAYFFQQLDKSSLSYVSIFGIIEDAHLTSRKISEYYYCFILCCFALLCPLLLAISDAADIIPMTGVLWIS